jgi:hypothetical protein
MDNDMYQCPVKGTLADPYASDPEYAIPVQTIEAAPFLTEMGDEVARIMQSFGGALYAFPDMALFVFPCGTHKIKLHPSQGCEIFVIYCPDGSYAMEYKLPGERSRVAFEEMLFPPVYRKRHFPH